MIKRFTFACLLMLLPASVMAQSSIELDGLNVEPTDEIEVTSEALAVDQDSGRALFTGNVIVAQGDMRLNAPEVEVAYDDVSGDITQIIATGGVTMITATEAAEADNAVYDLATGFLTMTENVLVNQGNSVLTSDRMVVNLEDDSAQMEGNVRSIFQQGGAE